MRQTLFYIPQTIIGFPVFGFNGILFAVFSICIVIAALWRLFKVRKLDSEVFSYLLLGMVVGFILGGVAPHIIEPAGFPVRSYGVCLLFAFLSAICLSAWIGSSRGIPADAIISLGFWVTICGIIGTRIFYVIEYMPELEVRIDGELQLLHTVYNILNIANGGLVVIGGIIGGATGAIIFALKNKYHPLVILDVIVPTVMLGIAIGRIGCFLNGCCFGAICDLPWAVTFPEKSPAHVCQIERGDTTYCGLKLKMPTKNHKSKQLILDEILPQNKSKQTTKLKAGLYLHSIDVFNPHKKIETYRVETPSHLFNTIDYFQHEYPNQTIRFNFFDESNPENTISYTALPQHSGVLPVHPTQIYSSILALILCGILLLLGKLNWFRTRKGGITAAFLILYGCVRFNIEKVRTDEEPFLNTGLTIAQNLSIVMFIIGLSLLIYIAKTKKEKAK